jgi:RNA polymerase sigma-70 factor (ECF subfamily)
MTPDPLFENLVELYYRDLYRFAYGLVRNEADAADLTQQTFFIWANKGHQIRDQAQVKSWLFTTLHREFLQKHRREIRFSHQEISIVEDELPQVMPDTIQKMDARMLLDYLGRLDALYRGPLVLHYLQDLPYKEIAAGLGVPLGTVQSRISRGKALLYKMLAGPGDRDSREGSHE